MTVDHPQWGLMCCICFNGLTPETCVVDEDGQKWDICKGQCAIDAGIIELIPSPEPEEPSSLGE